MLGAVRMQVAFGQVRRKTGPTGPGKIGFTKMVFRVLSSRTTAK